MGVYTEKDLELWEEHLVDMAVGSEGALTYDSLKKMPIDELIMVRDRQVEIARLRKIEMNKPR